MYWPFILTYRIWTGRAIEGEFEEPFGTTDAIQSGPAPMGCTLPM